MKLGAWMVMLTTMLIFLTLLGIETGLNYVLETIGIDISNSTLQGADVISSSFWTVALGVLTIVSGGSVIIGLFAKGYDPSLVIAPFVTFIGTLYIPTLVSLINYVSDFNQWWMTALIITIFGGFAVGFIMAMIDYFAGR